MEATFSTSIQKIKDQSLQKLDDVLAVEEPLEIQLSFYQDGKKITKPISITMRTPKDDKALALGFLYTEGIIKSNKEIANCQHLTSFDPSKQDNQILVELKESVKVQIDRLDRHFYTSSSCGVCGKASIDALKMQRTPNLKKDYPVFQAKHIMKFPSMMQNAQQVFQDTGGIHAAALFNLASELVLLKEDVGRHNAVDKLIGQAFLDNKLPLNEHLIMVSGRASFELIQKAVMVDIPILAAVGAPSSLAVQLAEDTGMTLLGFVKNQQMNCYTHPNRIKI